MDRRRASYEANSGALSPRLQYDCVVRQSRRLGHRYNSRIFEGKDSGSRHEIKMNLKDKEEECQLFKQRTVQLEDQISILLNKISQLEAELASMRSRNQYLEDANADLYEKNSIIEKYYIKGKYYTSKLVAEKSNKARKSYAEQLNRQIYTYVEAFFKDFSTEESIDKDLCAKIEQLINSLVGLSLKELTPKSGMIGKMYRTEGSTKEVKYKYKVAEYLGSCQQETRAEVIKSILLPYPITLQVDESSEVKLEYLPKTPLTDSMSSIQDAYYGYLEEYEQLETKLVQRKNDELAKYIFRSSESKRKKKIFSGNHD